MVRYKQKLTKCTQCGEIKYDVHFSIEDDVCNECNTPVEAVVEPVTPVAQEVRKDSLIRKARRFFKK